MEDQFCVLEGNLAEVEQILAASQETNAAKEEDVIALNSELDELRVEVVELQDIVAQKDVEQKAHSAALTELEAQRADLEAALSESVDRINLLEKQVDEYQNDVAEYEVSLKRRATELENLASQKAEVEASKDAMAAKAAELETQLSSAHELVSGTAQSLKAAEAEIESYKLLSKDVDRTKQALASIEEAHAEAVRQRDHLQATIHDTQDELRSRNEELENLKAQLESSNRTSEQMAAAVAVETKKVSMQQTIITELRGENDALRSRRNAATSTYHEEHARLLSLEREAVQYKMRVREAEVAGKQSTHTIAQLTSECKQLRSEQLELAHGFEKEAAIRQSVQAQLKDAQFREQCLLSEVEQQNSKLMSQISTHTAELQAAQAKIASLSEELRTAAWVQTRQNSESEGAIALKADLVKLDASLQYERQKTRRLQNQIQDLKGNIRVAVRIRPSVSRHLNNLQVSSDAITMTSTQAASMGVREVAKTYRFDRVFGPDIPNKVVCEETEYLIQSALDGHNVCIFAYGQTGSGKTWTMASSDGVGVTALQTVMEVATHSSRNESPVQLSITVESVEIYNEQFRDLLDDSPMLTGPVTGLVTGNISRYGRPSVTGAIRDGCGIALKLNENTRQPELVGTMKVRVTSASHAVELFEKAARARSVAATAANARSSRSHFVFIVHIERRNKYATNSVVQHGTLNLVDLAGSERLTHSKTTGDRLVETTAINSSLSTLGNVIKTLASRDPARANEPSRSTEHLTYRDSKLTFLLQGSLSGGSKAMLLATLSPEADHANETRSTLQFADMASKATVRH